MQAERAGAGIPLSAEVRSPWAGHEWAAGVTGGSAAIEQLFLDAPIGMALLERSPRVLRINAALGSLLDVEAGDYPDDEPLIAEVSPAATLRRRLRWVLETGKPVRERLRLGRSGGEAAAAYFPLRDELGSVMAAAAVLRERTGEWAAEGRETSLRQREQEAAHVTRAARTRLELLARAGRLLSSSLDYEQTLRNVADLLVPELADWAFVELLQPDGSIKRVAMAHFDPVKEPLIRDFDRRYPIDPDAPEGSAKVIRTGQAEVLPEIPDEILEAVAQDREHLRLLHRVGFRSSLLVPLKAGGRVLGDIALVTAESGRRYGEDDLVMAQELADRCAQAVENARLYSERSFIARALQAALLPPVLPQPPGLEVAARYRAAGEGTDVGGDFYDLFELSGARWMAVIGDVTGKGPLAAGVTALVRHTIRGAAAGDRPPADVLEVLNRALLRHGAEEPWCTAACIRIELGSPIRLTVAVAGHPPPLLRRADGSVERAGGYGLLLGCDEDVRYSQSEHVLQPGDAVVAYTDGVSEAGHPERPLGEEGIAELLADPRCTSASELVRTLVTTVLRLERGSPRDDVAVLAVGATDQPADAPSGALG